jgi:DNA-binding MarR family transcriptional regulator
MGRSLGEFEQMVLASVLRLSNRASSVEILEAIEARTGRVVRSGALSVTLDRLEAMGLVESVFGYASPDRGGRPGRYTAVTPAGAEAAREAQSAMLALWSDLDTAVDG